jgi:transposase
VVMVLDQGQSYCSVARQLQTSDRLVSRWVNAYKLHGIKGLSFKSNRGYSGTFKLRLLHEMQKNALSLHQMSAQYRITPSALSVWRRLYEQYGALALLEMKPRGRPKKMKKHSTTTEGNPTDYEKLLKENERLRIENDYLKKVRALIQKKETQKRGGKPKPSRN